MQKMKDKEVLTSLIMGSILIPTGWYLRDNGVHFLWIIAILSGISFLFYWFFVRKNEEH